MGRPLWKRVWQFFKKLNGEFFWDPAISLPGVYPKELKTYVHIKTCTQMFIEASFIIAKKRKHLNIHQMPNA